MSSLSVGLRYPSLTPSRSYHDLESPFKNLIYIEEFRRGQTEASIFEAPPFKMHYAGRRSTIGGRDGHEQKGKRKRKRERERVDRTRPRDGERRNDLDGECERNDERERTERTRQKKKKRKEKMGVERGKGKERKREMICLSPERRTARRMSRTRGYRGTEETGLRPNMIIELGERRCERSTL